MNKKFGKSKYLKIVGTIIILVVVLIGMGTQVHIRSVSQYQSVNQTDDQGSNEDSVSSDQTLQTEASNESDDKSDDLDSQVQELAESESDQSQTTATENSGTLTDSSEVNIANTQSGDQSSDQSSAQLSGVASNTSQTASDAALTTGGETSQSTQTTTQDTDSAGSSSQSDAGASSNEAEVKYITCTIEIRCDAASNKKSEISNAGIRDVIPDDGTILASTSYTAKEGITVYEVLRDVTSEQGIVLSASKSGYGMYVNGINNLTQKMVGATSGWVYLVNGVFASKASDQYVVADGDQIYWKYVTDYSN